MRRCGAFRHSNHAELLLLFPATARYPAEAAGYDLQHEVGHGATATVWAARAKACGDFVAVKMFYLDRLKGDKVLGMHAAALPTSAASMLLAQARDRAHG